MLNYVKWAHFTGVIYYIYISTINLAGGKTMQSTFNTSRIFNDMDGWYVVMRASDEKHLTSTKHKIIGDQHLMGPFINRHRVEDWLEGYLAMHATDRNTAGFIPDSIDTHH